jgi:hypothetical protein
MRDGLKHRYTNTKVLLQYVKLCMAKLCMRIANDRTLDAVHRPSASNR